MGAGVYRTAREMLRDLVDGRISARELLDLHLARDRELDDRLSVVVVRDPERAERVARAIDDARVAGEPLGPLAGLPMTVKDCFDVAGMPAVAGDPDLIGRALDCPDADVVARVREAGAIIWGKTNVPRRNGDWQSTNLVFGTTRNPYDPARTPGGSSGGSAAALAAGITPLEVGSDIGGSLRLPAAFCGVYALKPTWNLLPQAGHVPPDPGVRENPPRDLNVVGPMARNPGDLRLLHGVLTGVPRAATRGIVGRRVGVWLDQPGFPLARECRGAVDRVAAALESLGVEVRPAPLALSVIELLDVYHALIRTATGEAVPGVETTLSEHEARMRRAALQRRLRAFFDEGWDAILTPATMVPAFPHDTRPFEERTLDVDGLAVPYRSLIDWSSLATALHAPSIAVPVGSTPAGLPVGVQLVGPWHGEDDLLDFADALDEVFGFRTPVL